MAISAYAATNDLTTLLQQGLFEEEANRNLDAAISNYESLARQFDKDRQIAATAVFRLGECYRKLGRTNDAVLQYERIVREFSDQQTLVTLSRQNLAGMGSEVSPRTRVSESANEAEKLATQLAAIDRLKDDPEKQARAVFATFPDEDLKKMLLQLPFLQEQDAWLAAHPNLSFDSSAPHSSSQTNVTRQIFYVVTKPGGDLIERGQGGVGPGIRTLLQRHLKWISERVGFIIENQRARLQILQGVAPGLPSPGANQIASAEYAISDEDQEIRRIQAMIQNSPDLINSTTGGSTPLIEAASKGQFRAVTFLLDHGANINLTANGTTPLISAVKTGNKAMAELLLNRGADVNATDATGGTALHAAASDGFLSVAEVLLAHHADLNARDSEANSGRTPLHLAAKNGRVEMIKLLVRAGADVNARSFTGATPLLDAVQFRQPSSVAALLEAKADPNLAGNGGFTPLSVAVLYKEDKIADQLLAAHADPNLGPQNPPLFGAIKNQNTNLVERLLAAGADPNRSARLDTRAYTGNGSGDFTNSPLQFSLDQPEMVRLLLKFKANPNGTPESGPLLFSVLFNDSLALLLDAGADPNVVATNRIGLASEGDTPLIAFATAWTSDRFLPVGPAESLIAHHAKINVHRASDGNTPLHLAAQIGNRELVELLLKNGAEVNIRNNRGSTPMDLAKEYLNGPARPARVTSITRETYEEIIALLRQHGARDDLPDFSVIRVTRQGLTQPITVFARNTNDWNHFTLLETLLKFYSEHPPRMMGGFGPGSGSRVDPQSLSFPDLTRIIIHRPSPKSDDKEDVIRVNVLNATNGIDCAKDIRLEFGDVVEIPIREYRLQETPVGLTTEQSSQIADCEKRSVTVKVRDQTRALTPYPASAFLSQVIQFPEVQSLLLSSSDLSHVVVKRPASATAKAGEFVLDLAGHPSWENDLWLRDGDVIEIPEK